MTAYQETHTDPCSGCLLARVSCSGIWWMVSKQKQSLRSEQRRDYEQMMDGSVSCIASLQHTALTTQHIIPPKENERNFGRKHPPTHTHTHTYWHHKITSHGHFFKYINSESCVFTVQQQAWKFNFRLGGDRTPPLRGQTACCSAHWRLMEAERFLLQLQSEQHTEGFTFLEKHSFKMKVQLFYS